MKPIKRIFMTDAQRGTDPHDLDHLPSGTLVVFRDYDHAHRDDLGAAYAAKARALGLPLFVAADPLLAEKLHADGLHLPNAMLDKVTAHSFSGQRLSASCHNRNELIRAAQYGAGFVIISPIHHTRSHDQATPLGRVGLFHLLDESPIPAYAMGGMNEENFARLGSHPKLMGFAAIGTFLKRVPEKT